MKAYKGFNKDMTCRDFQYEEGKTYETDEVKMCESGFHACEDPLDCFRYYDPAESVYHEVEIEDNGERQSNDTKVVGKKITIGAELSLKDLIKAKFEYNSKKCTSKENGGDQSAVRGGNWSAVQGGYLSVLLAGVGSKFRGGMRSVFAYPVYEGSEIVKMAVAVVDGEKIKPNTWYTVKNGEWVEAE